MSLETTPTVTHQLSNTLQKLQSDLENIQREVDQALGVWRQTLVSEKKEAQDALREKENQWAQHENEWQAQKAIFEAKIQELDQFYHAQISSVEQNALQALNELDDSWQRDKVSWNQTAGQRIKELETRETLLVEECQKREEHENYLEIRINELSHALADRGRGMEEQMAMWQVERDAYENRLRTLEESAQAAERHRELVQLEFEEKSQLAAAQEKLLWQTERDRLDEARRAAEAAFQIAETNREHAHLESVDALKASWEIEKRNWQSERDAIEARRVAAEQAFQAAERTRETNNIAAIEAIKSSWDRDKLAWQESHQQTIQKFSANEKAWADEWQKQNRAIRQLEEQLATVQAKLSDVSARSSHADHLLVTSLEALDNQVALLNEVMALAARPTHPLRRRTDAIAHG